MFPALKKALLPAALVLLALGLGSALQTQTASCHLAPTWTMVRSGSSRLRPRRQRQLRGGNLRPDGEKIEVITGPNVFQQPLTPITSTDDSATSSSSTPGETILMCVQPVEG